MKLYYQNVRGLNGKCHLILPLVSMLTYDIICWTETWLQSGFADGEVIPTTFYTVHRKDRNLNLTGRASGGGVLIATKVGLNARRLPGFESPDLEIVWLRIPTAVPTYLCCIYLPARSISAPYISFVKSLQDNISIIEEEDYRLLICGDFNLPTLSWLLHSDGYLELHDYLAGDLHGTNAEIVHAMNCFELRQFNRLTNCNNRILDLALSDLPASEINCTEPDLILCSLMDRHHPPYQLNLLIERPSFRNDVDPKRFNFFKANYDQINAKLASIIWENELLGSVDDMVTRFYEIIMSIMTQCIPLKGRRFPQYPIWFSTALILTLRRKNFFHRRRYVDPAANVEFRRLRHVVKQMSKRCFKRYCDAVERNMSSHMKEFWRFTKTLRKTNSYPSSMHLNLGHGALLSSTNEGISNLFGIFFESVYDPDEGHPASLFSKCNSTLARLCVTHEQVTEALARLDTDKRAGEYGISNFFLAKTASQIAKPLVMIFNASLATGIFPTRFKDTIIHPVFKDGDQHDVKNYRPIAILNAMAKVFERLVHGAVLFHVSPFLSEAQHGFLPKKSTVTNLLEYVTCVAEALDKREQIDALYLDFSKAFDKISHRILFAKLDNFGIAGPLLSWFKSYVSERSLSAVFNGARSEKFIPSSGVPQGSILGPLLFTIYIDELADCLDS